MHNCNISMDLWESVRLCHRPHGRNTSPGMEYHLPMLLGELHVVNPVSFPVGVGPTLGQVAGLSIIIVCVCVCVCVCVRVFVSACVHSCIGVCVSVIYIYSYSYM